MNTARIILVVFTLNIEKCSLYFFKDTLSRYLEGVFPVMRLNARLKVVIDEKPT